MKKNSTIIIVSFAIITGIFFALWNKSQQSDKPPFVGERSQYKGEELEKAPNFLLKEQLSDDSTKYLLSSEVLARPHMYILKDGQILIQRSVISPNYPVKISDFTKSYGEPPLVRELKAFYEPKAKLFVYPEERIAFIANPETQDVLEQHVFTVTLEEYLEKYSERK